ncbi:hypothetical protein [Variovorax sp. JS1663]|uniref:hypothetical protein n=1 Tax=Variovorax sp. JS1663 TaxID=1851577 RepID=UPI000B348118|nr:hypothetical protein [Variovorax sp. JS1663]OUM02402.1 hypothetical protein A8M77_10510 [Variovorax sp. JS1663]OUM02513.1 hypothetical protein A8M77_11135 [Variovorax sp. JS1663]
MKKIVIACGLVLAGSAYAKLPAPAATPEAQAKAAETAARTAWSGKVEAYQLCQAQDRVAARYRASATAAGKQLPPAPAGSCADPGPFAYTPPDQKPIEAAGAHSPPGTASSPPSTQQPAAAANPTPKQ